MNKLIVALYDDEEEALDGLEAIQDLHKKGEISLYTYAIVQRDDENRVMISQSEDENINGTTIGFISGEAIGFLATPMEDVASGAVVGGLSGMIDDVHNSTVDYEFTKHVSDALISGQIAVIADIYEQWAVPLDQQIRETGGIVHRRIRSEMVDEQISREVAAFRTGIAELQDDWNKSTGRMKQQIENEIEEMKVRMQDLYNKTQESLRNAQAEVETKITSLKKQLRSAKAETREKLEHRLEEIRADFEYRSNKLREAASMASQAIHPH